MQFIALSYVVRAARRKPLRSKDLYQLHYNAIALLHFNYNIIALLYYCIIVL